MGFDTHGGKVIDGPPPESMPLHELCRTIDNGNNDNGSPPSDPPPPNGGDESPPGQTKWAMMQEVARDGGGNIVRCKLGTDGYIFSVDEHSSLGYGKTTGHKDGTLHRHGYMSDQAPKDDFVKSNIPHRGLLGDIIRRFTK
jgi:hypothetical protein